MRIGEVAARTGVAPATLRAWERRYGLLRPGRTSGGQRDYSDEDVARVRAVVALVQAGARVSEATRRVAGPQEHPTAAVEETRQRLWEALDSFEEAQAVAALTSATTLGTDVALDDVFVPTLRRLGAEWRESPRNIAREHFASTLLRAHLVRLLPTEAAAVPWLGFCPEGELHDIGLLMAALAAGVGQPQIVLGANTPAASVGLLLKELRPAVVLVAATSRRAALRFLDTWRPLPRCNTVAGGAGFRPEDEPRLGGRVHRDSYARLAATIAAAR